MKPTPEMLSSIPFQYAANVRSGKVLTGKRIRQAVDRFYSWIENAEKAEFTLDHKKGMRAILFFQTFLNHTVGKLAGKPFVLAPFQQFTIYNVFGWLDSRGFRRINTVYDKRAKKNGKTAEMAGLGLLGMTFDMEMGAQIYIGATKEEQAMLCWKQARSFIESPLANPAIRHIHFKVLQKVIENGKTESSMRPLGGDSKTQDGINAHFAIIDEYHAHKDDSVKENLESSSVQRNQPLTYHITTAGTNVQSACKKYEDSVIEILEGRVEDNHLWIMIHDLDEGDDWENEKNWFKANPLLGQGLDIEQIRKECIKAKNQPSKIPNFKTKHLNMWVDAPHIWIPNEIWMANKHDLTPDQVKAKFQQFGGYVGVDISINTDLTAAVAVSNPDDDGMRYVVPNIFCPKDTIDKRSKDDRVNYRYWADNGFIIATPGNQVDFDIVEEKIKEVYKEYNIERVEGDQYQFAQMAQNLMKEEIKVSYFSQSIVALSAPTKAFERLVYNGQLQHDGHPVLAWNLAGCLIIADANENIKVHKGKSNTNGRRIDGIPALINALGGSMSIPEETNESSYLTNGADFTC